MKFKNKYSFIFFHLNLFFSSLPENKRKEVIDKCYWPLLDLIENFQNPIGVEITGWTLETIYKKDKNWVKKFKFLLDKKKIYLIGSSYTQAIFPLIPYEVNRYNLEHGKKIYKKILNCIPKIAYINEQCFSKSLVDLYKGQNFDYIILDWDSIRGNNKLLSQFKFFPQKIKGNKDVINVIWNSSTNFQNFQKNIHSKINTRTYFNIIKKVNQFKNGLLSVYGSDAEIFDFRLKRYEHEQELDKNKKSEWEKILDLLNLIKTKFTFINLNNVNKLNLIKKFKNNILDITSAENILPTKKQKKYNPLRWYVGGIDNFSINTFCWKIFENKKNNKNILKDLCYYWSSDFRTHIETKRWNKFFLKIKKEASSYDNKSILDTILNPKFKKKSYNLDENGDFIYFENKDLFFRLDKERGLSLGEFGLKKENKKLPFIKKYDQGDFRNERLNVDFFNGHNVSENSNFKVTDLDRKGIIKIKKNKNILIFNNYFKFKKKIEINKTWYFDLSTEILYLQNKIKLFETDFLSIRANYFNLNYEMFDLDKLKISTKNGGKNLETFYLKNSKDFFYDEPISSKFTAQNCFGNTDGSVEFNDNNSSLKFHIFHENGSCAPMLNFLNDGYKKYFLRFLTTFKENNDTSRQFKNKKYQSLISIKLK